MSGIEIKGEKYGEKSDIAEGIKQFIEPEDIKFKGILSERESIQFSILDLYLSQIKDILGDGEFVKEIKNMAKNIEKRKLSINGRGRDDAVKIFTKEMKNEIEKHEMFKKMVEHENK